MELVVAAAAAAAKRVGKLSRLSDRQIHFHTAHTEQE